MEVQGEGLAEKNEGLEQLWGISKEPPCAHV